MPLYEYQCRNCGAQFEKLVLSRDASIACNECSSAEVTQLLSVFSVSSGGARKAASEPGPCGACGAAVRGSCGMN